MKTEGGTELWRQKDGSILASEEPVRNETYVITSRVKSGKIAAIRLEALPHDSLPRSGPGWGSANFHLTEFRALLQRSGQDAVPLRFRQAVASHTRSIAEGAGPHDGPWAVTDGNHETLWDIWPHSGHPNWLTLSLTEPVDVKNGDLIIVHLDFRDRRWPRAKLGCFRLSVGDDDSSAEKLRLIDAVREAQFLGLDALAAAHLATGNAARAAELLRALPETSDSQVRLMLRGMAQRVLGESTAARETTKRLVESLKTQAPPRTLQECCFEIVNEFGGLDRQQFDGLLEEARIQKEISRLTKEVEANPASPAIYTTRGIYFARLGRWRESAADYLQAVKLDPGTDRPWGIAASALLHAGDTDGYRQHCRAMLKQFHGTKSALVADIVCKTNLLLADNVDMSELPTLFVRMGAVDPTFGGHRPWLTADNALISYREGKPADAIDWTRKMSGLGGDPGALALVVRAMSEEKLGQHDQAVKSLAAAAAMIPAELRTLGTRDYNGPLVVPAATINHDWLVTEILRREADALIHGNARKQSPP
jgi:tetratricopeptide (TPR) repeat protein